MYIYGPSHLHGSAQMGRVHRAGGASELTGATGAAESSSVRGSQMPCDEVQLSEGAQRAAEASRLTDVARSLPDVRMDLVMRVRSEIARGMYETPEKLDVAVGRMFDEIG